MGARVYGGSWTYPVYCFCVEKTVVQVPTGGVLKVMVMFPSTGDFIVVMSGSSESGGGNCPKMTPLCSRTQNSAESNAFDRAQNSRYASLVVFLKSIWGGDVPSSSTINALSSLDSSS